jgi:phosphoribosylglycinamide formyltransferase-1
MKIVVMASGAGSTLEFLLNKQSMAILSPRIVGLITDNPAAGALQVAEKFKIPAKVVSPRDYNNFADWDSALAESLVSLAPDIVLLAGFLKKIGPNVLNRFQNRIFNSHPSLLPKFGGHGMYGRRVHEAVVGAAETESGVTIHIVNGDYDQGPILKQARLKLQLNETVESLEQKIKVLEKDTLLEFLNSCQV